MPAITRVLGTLMSTILIAGTMTACSSADPEPVAAEDTAAATAPASSAASSEQPDSAQPQQCDPTMDLAETELGTWLDSGIFPLKVTEATNPRTAVHAQLVANHFDPCADMSWVQFSGDIGTAEEPFGNTHSRAGFVMVFQGTELVTDIPQRISANILGEPTFDGTTLTVPVAGPWQATGYTDQGTLTYQLVNGKVELSGPDSRYEELDLTKAYSGFGLRAYGNAAHPLDPQHVDEYFEADLGHSINFKLPGNNTDFFLVCNPMLAMFRDPNDSWECRLLGHLNGQSWGWTADPAFDHTGPGTGKAVEMYFPAETGFVARRSDAPGQVRDYYLEPGKVVKANDAVFFEGGEGTVRVSRTGYATGFEISSSGITTFHRGDSPAELDRSRHRTDIEVLDRPMPSGVSQAPVPGATHEVWYQGATSPEFAAEVYRQWKAQGAAPRSLVNAKSPVTNQTYLMECLGSAGHIHCRGGNNANVFISYP